MKTIVFATDFSLNARRAARFACQLAYDQQATLILFHAYHVWPDNPAKTGDFPLSVEAERKSSEKALEKLADELRELTGVNVSIRCVAQEGHTINAIREIVKAEHADLLIMSTVGTAPQSAQLMGSIATGMVAETEVPLLLIPPSAGYAGIKNTVLCINLAEPPNAIALESAVAFIKAFGSVINVLCISENPDDPDLKERSERIRQLLVSQPHTMSIVGGKEIYEILLHFAHDNKADLIIMLPQTRSWFWKLFSEGETQRMARLTDLPLLSIA